jgi:hypothetical protein
MIFFIFCELKYLGIFFISIYYTFLEILEIKKMPKNADIFHCKKCNFICSKKSNYDKHITTRKHNMELSGNKKNAVCDDCGKEFKTCSGLWKHKRKCSNKIYIIEDMSQNNSCMSTTQIHDMSVVIELLKQNHEFKELMVEQSKQIQQTQLENHELHKQLIEAVKSNGSHIENQTINNNNHQKFNLNFFLNDTCKDAMNMSEFIENMNVQFDDIENIGRDGYVTGMTNMILSRIKNLEVTKRPMHCTDLKRETIYIKDNNVWEKDNDNTKLHNMIQCIARKNYAILPAWRDKNPDCLDSDTSKFDFCIKMMTNLLGDAGEGQVRLDNKVIRNLSKHINVDKNTTV